MKLAYVWPYPPPDKGKTERESFVRGRVRLHAGYNERETNAGSNVLT